MIKQQPYLSLRCHAILLPLIASLGLAACGGSSNSDNTEQVQTAQISGQVVDGKSGAVIANATVSFAGKTTTTDANGGFSISGVSAGIEYTLTVTAANYNASTSSKITLSSGQNLQNQNVLLTPRPNTQIALRVFDARTGEVVKGATVSVASLSASSNTAGDAILLHVVPNERVLVTIRAAGYADQVVVVSLDEDQSITGLNAQLIPLLAAGEVSPALGGTVTLAGSTAQVVLPANSLRRLDGQPIVGPVSVKLALVDPTQDISQMPGQMLALNSAGVQQLIESFGAMTIQLTDTTGAEVGLQSGARANVRIPVMTRGTVLPSIPLYYFDLTSGFWRTDGTLLLNNSDPDAMFYEGTSSTLGTVNADVPYNPVQIKGCIEDQTGQRIKGASLLLEGVDYSGYAQVQTDANGVFTAGARPNSLVALTGQQGRQLTNSKKIEVFSANQDLTDSCLVLIDSASNARIELTWGLLPQDVDAHLITPSGEMVYFGSKGALGQEPFVNLDVDDLYSYGPEVVTTSRLMLGTYQYYVNNYSFDFNPALTGSPVRVQLDTVNGTQVFTPNAGEVDNVTTAWHVFDFKVDAQCRITVIPVKKWLDELTFDSLFNLSPSTPTYCVAPTTP